MSSGMIVCTSSSELILNDTPYGTDESPYAFFKMSRDERGLQKPKPADATAMATVIIIEM
jgi:hypothetical protein